MNWKRHILGIALAAGCLGVSAQESKRDAQAEFRPHGWMQVQAGIGNTLGEAKFGKLASPAAALSAGYRFTPVWGLRGGFGGWQGKGSWVSPRQGYKFNYLQLNVDAVVDLANWWGGYNHRRFFNPYLFAGIGGNLAFNNDEAVAVNAAGYPLAYLWEGSKCFGAGRMGLGMDFRLCDAVALNIEGNANVTSDRFNSKKAGNADWQFNLLAGVSIRLGKGYKKKPAPAPAVPATPVTPAAPVKKEQPQPAKEVEKPLPVQQEAVQPMRQEVFFALNSATIRDGEQEKIAALAAYLRQHPAAKVTVTGYADRQTGNPRYNLTLSERRAEAVADALAQAGIARNRILPEGKGDTVQPFASQAQNRVAVCVTK